MRLRNMRALNLFLSYARADAELAGALRKQLSMNGHTVWQDTEELLAGDSFEQHIRRTLRTCDGYVVLVTPNSLKSSWVLIELGGAWVGGLKIFPVVADTTMSELPGPLRQLSACMFEDVSIKLLPALSRLRDKMASESQDFDADRINELARERTAGIPSLAVRTSVAAWVTDALSTTRLTRRMAHTAVQQATSSARASFLEIMLELARHPNDRIRGEAFYCLGSVTTDGKTFIRPESFFLDGLSDESTFVQACCANVLRNFAPLGTSTVSSLQECLGANVFRVHADERVASLVYYASIALNHDRSLRAT